MMNRLLKNHTRRLLVFVSILMLSTIGINLLHTELASARWVDDVGDKYIAYENGSSWLYWNSRYNTWAFIKSTPQIKLNGSACDTKDADKDFNSSATFWNCKGLVFTAKDNAAFFNEAQLAYQIADFDSAETATVEGGLVTKAGNSSRANIVIENGGKSARSKNGEGTKDDGGCTGGNPNTSNSCSILIIFSYGYGDAFKISLNNKWNKNGTASSGHEFWYDSPATKDYRTLTFNPNGGDITDSGDGVALWPHKSGSNALREYVRNSTASNYPEPKRTDYTFAGWYTAATGGTKAGSSRTMSSNETLYAHWEPAVPPNELYCGTSTFLALGGALIGAPQSFTISLSGKYSPPTSITAAIVNALGQSVAVSRTNSSTSGNTVTATYTFTPTASSTYTLSWTATDGTINVGPCPGGTTFAGTRPYFEVSGGDVLTGPSSAASFISWNRDSGDYAGANNNLAVIATGNINGVITGKGNTSNLPKTLSFANNGSSTYGGSFSPSAIPSLGNTAPTVTTTTPSFSGGSLTGLAQGLYRAAGNVTISASTLSNKKITIVATGNVYISGNITYTYASLTDIPRLTIYASNIIIGGAVTEIHGTFRATSNFYSCGSGVASYVDYANLDTAANTTLCNTQLKVYGAVSANQLILTRTKGSWHDGSGSAEQFLQGPETWVNNTRTTTRLDNYVSLPPVL